MTHTDTKKKGASISVSQARAIAAAQRATSTRNRLGPTGGTKAPSVPRVPTAPSAPRSFSTSSSPAPAPSTFAGPTRPGTDVGAFRSTGVSRPTVSPSRQPIAFTSFARDDEDRDLTAQSTALSRQSGGGVGSAIGGIARGAVQALGRFGKSALAGIGSSFTSPGSFADSSISNQTNVPVNQPIQLGGRTGTETSTLSPPGVSPQQGQQQGLLQQQRAENDQARQTVTEENQRQTAELQARIAELESAKAAAPRIEATRFDDAIAAAEEELINSQASFDEEITKIQEQDNALVSQIAAVESQLQGEITDIREQPIPAGFLVGQAAATARRFESRIGTLSSQRVPLQQRLATAQARRASALDVIGARLENLRGERGRVRDLADEQRERQQDLEDEKRKAEREAEAARNAPPEQFTLGQGAVRVDENGRVIFSNPRQFAPQAQDDLQALIREFPDSTAQIVQAINENFTVKEIREFLNAA